MDVTVDLDAPCTAAELFAWVDDLSHYPNWLSIVPKAQRQSGDGPPGQAPDMAAWSVDLRARLGPLARSKRLRMVRTDRTEGLSPDPFSARFERRELDGRSHAEWVLRADVTDRPPGSRLTMHLHYGGSLWGPVLERYLREEISRSRQRLLACVSGAPPTD